MSRYVALTIAVFALVAAPAQGAGGPVAGSDALGEGVTTRGLGVRYIAQIVPGGTVVMAIERRGGRVLDTRFLRRPLIVSAVAYDGSSTGLAASGSPLVLASPRYALVRRRSDFVVLETTRLRRVTSFSLRGDFALDAISPDGDRLYFIQTRRNGAAYAVRAYDVARQRLLPRPVVDPGEPDEPMQGSPMARAMSHDGRWAYTLYDAPHPFIHALDTERARAKCVDLDALTGRDDLIDMRLTVAGDGTVLVHDGSTRPIIAVDPRSFAVRVPRPAAPARSSPPAADESTSWLGPAAGLALLALLIALALRAGRARMAPRMR